MNYKKFKENLKSELDKITPNVYEDVVKKSSLGKASNAENMPLTRPKRPKWALVSAILSMCLVVAVIITCVVVIPKNDPKIKPVVKENATYCKIDINPSIEMVADSNNIVKSIRANNDDGEIVLASIEKNNIIGKKTIQESILIIADKASQLGFINANATATKPNAVKITTINADNKTEAINNEINETLKAYFNEKGIYTVVIPEVLNKQDLVNEIKVFNSSVNEQIEIEKLNEYIKNRKNQYAERLEKLSIKFSEEEVIESLYKKEVVEKYLSLLENRKDALTQLDCLNNKIFEQSMGLYDGFDTLSLALGDVELKMEFKKAYEKCLSLFECKILPRFKFEAYNLIYNRLMLTEFFDILNSVYDDFVIFKSNVNNVINSLKDILGEVDEIDEILKEIPSDIESYIEIVKKKISYKKNSLAKEFNESYNKVRNKINENVYMDMINGIIENYGSLNNYYDKITA